MKVAREPFRIQRPMPRTLWLGLWILTALASTELVVSLVSFFTFDWATYLAKAVHPFVRNGVRREVGPAIAIGAIAFAWLFGTLVNGFQIVLALLMRRALGWARILFTVYEGLYSAAGLLGGSAYSIVTSVVGVGVIVLVWLPPSSEYFRDVQARRRMHRSLQLR
jgi:hypothetical protein